MPRPAASAVDPSLTADRDQAQSDWLSQMAEALHPAWRRPPAAAPSGRDPRGIR
jgi:hypothetical protein